MSAMRSIRRSHWSGFRISRNCFSDDEPGPYCGWKPTWTWSSWSPIAKLGPPKFISEITWSGVIVPWSSRTSRTSDSVIEPGPWLPSTGMPLIWAMSTALPEEWCEMLPPDV